jgi:Cdc6-like AAA superfamily ATPase
MHDVDNIIFSPYTAEHIAEIMKDKITEVRTRTELEIVLSDRLLKYSSQKLETLKKGDFRVCLEFLKSVVQRALEKGQPEGGCEAKGEVDL